MSSGDELQIFIDADAQEIDFKDSFYDPVNKLRISNPENLIDTDFEYGLHSCTVTTSPILATLASS